MRTLVVMLNTGLGNSMWRLLCSAIAYLLLAGTSIAQPSDSTPKVRILISADMEGIAGAVTPVQITPGGSEYEHYRALLTDEVNAAIAGARRGGAADFVVVDAHGNFQNLLVDRLPKDVRVIRGGPRPLIMMDGIQDGSFDGVMFIGYHASSASTAGVRAHSFASAAISELKINGVPASEGYWNAALAGEFGVPVILASGDDAAVAELKAVARNAELVAVKRAIAFHAAETLTPEAGRDLIEKAAEKAVRDRAADRPFRIKGPITIDLMFHFYQPAELLSWLPGVQRTGARSVRFQAAQMVEATKFFAFIAAYNFNLQP